MNSVAFQSCYRQWLSSDYLLSALNYDPTALQKRLGDGFFEQKLIREQVGQLTGRRFLGDFRQDDEQYKALMASGASVAKQWNLRPGIALTAEQVASLTSDMVWLVEQDVTFTDGRTAKALVPVVYLSRVHTADLRPTGALISAQSLDIHAKGDFTNNGALQAQGSILLAANKVTNERGRIDAVQGNTRVISDTDIINRSGLIGGNGVQLEAGRDIQIDTITRQFSTSRSTVAGKVSGSNTEAGPRGSIVSRGDLSINARRDVLLAGAFVSAKGDASVNAGNNLRLDTLQTRQSTLDSGNSGVRQTQGSTNLASALQTGGNLTLASGADTTLKAAQISAGKDLSVMSGGNLTITAATDSTRLDENLRAKGYVRNDHTAQERVVGSQLAAGGNVTLAALQSAPDGSKGNITVQGSSVTATNGTLGVAAAGNVNIIEARQKSEYDLFNETKGSKTFSSKTQTAHDTGNADIAVGSALSGKEVRIVSGKDLTVRGSSVVSDDATTLIAKNNITLEAAHNSESSSSFREEKKSGLMSSGGIGFTVGKREQSTGQQNQSTTASVSTVGAVSGNVNIIVGSQYTQTGSDVLAPGGDISILAKRVDIQEARETSRSQTEQKFKQSGVTVALSNAVVSAVQSAASVAKAVSETSNGRMQALGAATAAAAAKSAADALKAGQGTTINGKEGQIATKVDSNGNVLESRDATAADKVGGINVSVSIGSSKSQSNASSASETTRGSSINAGGNVNITATGAGKDSDLLIQGSTVKAGGAVSLSADDEIKLLAAKNTGSQTSSNSASSGSIGVSFGTSGLSVNASASRASGSGNGSDTTYTNTRVEGNAVNVTSGGDTTLKGAVIAADQIKAKVGGNLDIESLQDSSTYREASKSSGLSISVPIGAGQFGGSVSADKKNINSNYQSVAEQSGIKAGDGGFDISVKGNTDLKGTVIASTDRAVNDGKNRFTTGGTLTTSDIQNSARYDAKGDSFTVGVGSSLKDSKAGFGSDKGSANSTTSAGVSGIAGNTAVRSTDVETGIKPIFDKDRVRNEINAQVTITGAFGQQAVPAAAKFADNKTIELRRQNNKEEAKKWDEKGAYRSALYGGLGLLTGGASGAAGALASATVVPAIGEEIAGLNLPEPVRQGLTQVMGMAVGAVAGGTSGVTSALPQTAFNYVSHSPFASVRRTVSQENARLTNECGANCTLADLRRIDLQMNKLETVGDLTEIGKNSRLTTEQAIRLGETVAALLPFYGTPIALYQAISGKSLTGEDLSTTERFFNGVAGAIPAGSVAYKLINSAISDMRLAASLGGSIGTDGKALMNFSKLTSQQKGVVGELLGPQTAQNVLPGATRLSRTGEIGSQGIDDLYKVTSKNADYVIVEYKFGTSPLGKTADGLQMSDGWVLGSDRVLNAVGKNQAEAEAIANAMKAGRVEKWVVHTDPAGGTSIWIVDAAGKIAKADSSIASKVLGSRK